MILFFKRIMYLPFYLFMLAKIKREILREYNQKIELCKQKLKHDTSVAEEDLDWKLVEEVKKLRKVMKEKAEQKIADLFKL